ncbi:DUF1752 family protein [Histoplasma capsulatum G186AR]|uniref:DUF1752 family protein n=1 Tax=Ajellomyces capsulatus TaxID=5037 RepID=A0A8H7ZAA9_AJECA|nr:DUF1752 family protein [Histoplasma capsulatum]QSS76037.1 DUF1752 family protein [Histoplasma capsulatum G186AR]
MTEALPKGIVLNSERISSEIESFGGVDAQDLAKLWRVYTTNRSTMKADEGRRLENLFWRIWSNNSILRTIKGTTLAGLFLHISEGESITGMARGRLREIPQSIPRVPSRRRVAPSTSSAQPESLSTRTGFKSSQKASRKSSVNSTRTPLPPPILKKPRQPSNDAQQTSNSSTVGASENVRGGDPSLSPSPIAGIEVSVGESSLEKPRRKKATFATNVTSMEAEPVSRRTKASQLPLDLSSARHSPTKTIRALPDMYGSSALLQQKYPISDESAISISPTPTTIVKPNPWLSQTTHRPGPTSNPTSHPAIIKSIHKQQTQQQKRSNSSPISQQTQPSTISLVEKDFRARFVEKQLQESRNSSFTNLGSSLLNRADIKGSATIVPIANTGVTRSQNLQSSADVKPVKGLHAVDGLGKIQTGGSSGQKQRPSQDNYNGSNGVVEHVYAEGGNDEGDWEDIDSDDDRSKTIFPSQLQLQSPFQQGGVSTSRPSLSQQQSQLSKLIEQERKLSATMQKNGKHV